MRNLNRLQSLLCILTFLLAVNAAQADGDECNAALSRFDYRDAMAAALKTLSENPEDGGQLICQARAQYETGDFRSALTSLQTAGKTNLAPVQRVLLQNWFAVTLRRLGREQEAWQSEMVALNLAREIGDTAGLGTALHNTAGMLYDYGYADQAILTYRESLAINPDAAERSASHNNIGLILQSRGDLEGAANEIEEAIRINRAGGHFHHLGKHLMNLGNLRRLQGRYEEALALINEGETLEAKAGDRYWLAVAFRYRGWLARDQGDVSLAKSDLQMARKLYAEAGASVEENQTAVELTALDN